MSVDISTLNLEVRSDGVLVATNRLDDLSKKGKKAEDSTTSLSSSISKMAAFVQTAAAGFAAWKLSQYIKDATLLAARVETLGVVMKVVGANAGYTSAQMDVFTAGLKKMGITTQESMSSLIKMAGAQMDLTKASQLARVAQDAAVIGGINSSEAFGRMIQGIRSGEVEILKTIGISVQFEQGYKHMAAQLGKTAAELTNAEKTASRMNQVLAFGTNIAGAYEASMSTAGKQIQSMSRYTEELKLKIGQIFTPVLASGVENFVGVLKLADKYFNAIKITVAASLSVLAGYTVLMVASSAAGGVMATTLGLIVTRLAGVSLAMFTGGGVVAGFGVTAATTTVGLAGMTTAMSVAAGGTGLFTAATTAATAALTALKISMAAHPIGWIIAALTTAVGLWFTYKAAQSDAMDAPATESSMLKNLKDEVALLEKRNKVIREGGSKATTTADAGQIAAMQDKVKLFNMLAQGAEETTAAFYRSEAAVLTKQIENIEQLNQKKLAAQIEYAKLTAAPVAVDDRAARDRVAAVERETEAAKQRADTIAAAYAAQQDQLRETNPLISAQQQELEKIATAYKNMVAPLKATDAGYKQSLATAEKIREEAIARVNLNQQLADDAKRGVENAAALLASERAITEEYERRLELERQMLGLRAGNDATAASMVGTNSTGGFDSIADETANRLAVEQNAHDKRLEWIEEQRKAVEKMNKDGSLFSKDYHDHVLSLDRSAALEKQKHSKATAKIADDGYRSSLAAASYYTGAASDAFTLLASTQDQSSRSGFESAKAYSIAAAVMNTAAGIMSAFASLPWPAAPIAAALVAATGVVQIAKISSTSFGSAGSVSAPSGSFGGASGGSAGGGFGATPMTGISDITVQNSDAMLAAQDRNTLVIGKLSKTIEELNGLFKEGGTGNGLAVNAPGRFTPLGEGESPMGNLLAGIKTSITGAWGYTMDLLKGDLSAVWGKTAQILGLSSAFGIGNKYYTTASGMSIGVNDGQFGVQDYTTKKKDGGWLTSSKTKTSYSDNADAGAYLNEVMRPFINDLGTMADTLGFVFDPTKYKASAIKINTAGKTSEQIGEELSALMASTLSGMTLTIDGLKGIVGNYEDAYTRIKQINDAWVTANEQLQLVGISPLAKGGGNAVNAENAQNSLYGGREGFIKAMDEYREVMYTQPERDAQDAAAAQRTVNTAWMEITASAAGAGLTLPKTKAEFNSLRASIDPNSPLFAALTGLGTAFATMTNAAEEAAKALQDTFLDTALSSANALKDIMGGPLSTLTPQQLMMQQEASFAAALASGNTANIGQMGKDLLTTAQGMYGSGTGYMEQYNNVTSALANVAGINGPLSLDSVDRQIFAITSVQTAINDGTRAMVASIAELKAEIAALRKQTDEGTAATIAGADTVADAVVGTFAAVARA